MKKILFAIMAVSAMALGFTSCEKKADVNVYPIAGKTYQATDADGYSRVTFKMDFGAVMEVKTTTQESYSDLYVWEMATKADQDGGVLTQVALYPATDGNRRECLTCGLAG